MNREQCSPFEKETAMPDQPINRYIEPGWFTRMIFNRFVRRLTLIGISVAGSRVLRVRGRSSGQWRSTPVNVLTLDGTRYLISPRGTTQWVRNLRVSGTGELRLGRRNEQFESQEVLDDAKLPILREYLRKWGWEVGQFFEGIDQNSPDDEVNKMSAGFPVFRIRAHG
jgi:hypothetical protein